MEVEGRAGLKDQGGGKRVKDENESSEGKKWEWDCWIFKNDGQTKTESACFVWLSIEIFFNEASEL